MAQKWYVYIDDVDGEEIRREPKGKGRPRKGSVKVSDTEWFITVKSDSAEAAGPQAPTAPKPKSEYIFEDADGKELRREPKGRGRARKGAEQREPGKWYIVEGAETEAPEEAPEETEARIAEAEGGGEEEGDGHLQAPRPRRTKKAPEKVDADHIIKCCKPLGSPITDGDVTKMHAVYVTGDIGFPGIKKHSVFHEVTIDRGEGTVSFLPLPGHTERVFTSALL